MLVNDAIIEKLCNLAMLEFTKEEKASLKADLEKMIGMVSTLQELDTSGVAPLLHMSANTNVYRQDAVGDMFTPQQALQNAALHSDAFFQVPKMIQKTDNTN